MFVVTHGEGKITHCASRGRNSNFAGNQLPTDSKHGSGGKMTGNVAMRMRADDFFSLLCAAPRLSHLSTNSGSTINGAVSDFE